MADKLKLKVIIGSTREGRFSEKPAHWILDKAKQLDVDTELLDLRDYPMPFLDTPVSPAYLNKEYKHDTVRKWSEKIEEADAFIIVTSEYNHGYPAVLKNALDWVFPEWNKKAVGFVGYGNAGGARSIEQLRQVVTELQMATIRRAIHISWDMRTEIAKHDVPVDPTHFGHLNEVAEEFLQELVTLATAMKQIRNFK